MVKKSKDFKTVAIGVKNQEVFTRLARMFGLFGYRILAAGNTRLLADEIRRQGCDAVVVDLNFMEWKELGKTGFSVFCHEIRSHCHREVPVVVMSPNIRYTVHDTQRAELKRAGATRCFVENFLPETTAQVAVEIVADLL